jgi:hypothetical protein
MTGGRMASKASSTIAQLIRTNPGYSAQVDLNLWFRDNAQNLATMRRYKPIASHRKAFERVAGALDNKDKRVYLITGNYGTGKSHLCLMLANYFAYAADQAEIAEFLNNYADEDRQAAEQLRARRRGGRFLVALCDYDSTDDFGEVVLRAVLDPLQEAGIGDALETPYEEARRKLEQLAKEQKSGTGLVDYYALFESQLRSHLAGVSIDKFKDRLYPGMDRSALDVFRRMHQDILRTPFTYEGGNLSAILRSTLKSPAFREKFDGIVVLWDEFGYTLAEPSRLSLNVFQQFAQLCTEFDPSRGKLIFIATAHKDFSAYAPAWAAIDYSKIRDRLEHVNLLPEGLEDVIGAIVSPDKSHPLWRDEVLPRAKPVWGQWVPACKKAGIFGWLLDKPPMFQEKILEGVYPMHPMATYSVIELAREVASQNRTVFTFFSSEKEDVFEEGSYLSFVHSHPIADANGQLHFYTVDRLFEYFHNRLQTSNPDLAPTAKEQVANYEAARTQLQRVQNHYPLEMADLARIQGILRTMLVYDLIDVQNSLANIAFGLNARPGEEKVIQSQLRELSDHGVVHRHPVTLLYEFRRSDIFDVDKAVEDYKREFGDKLVNLAVELNALLPLSSAKSYQYLDAKAYNAQHNEDKRLGRRIVATGDLGTTSSVDGQAQTYFDLLDQEVEREVARDGDFEGIAIYALCETQAEMSKAHDLAAKMTSPRLVVAIPVAPIPLKDAILNLKAIEHIRSLPQAGQFSTQDNALLVNREVSFRARLRELRDQLLDDGKLTWLGRYGKPLPADAHKPGDAATRVMQRLYTRRNAFSHDDFNRTHDVRNFTKQHRSLTEAVQALLRTGYDLTIDEKLADNRGEKRYLQRCLYQRGALAPVQKQGSATVVEVERDLNKFEPFLPPLAQMIRDVRALRERERIRLKEFINKYRQPPYGLGDIALSLLLATLVRFFGDTIKIKNDDAAIGDVYLADFETVADIVKGNYPDSFIRYREIRPGERELIGGVYRLFGNLTSAADVSVTTTNAYEAVASWLDELPPVAQVSSLYQDSDQAEAAGFLDILLKLRAQDPHAFVLGELQTVLGYDPTELVTAERANGILEALAAAKRQIEGTLDRVQSHIQSGLRDIFAVRGNTWDDVADSIRAWYNDLDSNQRSTTASWHNDASKALVQLFLDLSNPREIFLDKLPERPSYGFGRVRDWNADLTKDYLAKIREGVQNIEENRIKVPPPELAIEGKYRQENTNVFFSGPLRLNLSHADPTVSVFVTDSGADPIAGARERDEFQGHKSYDIHKLTQARRAAVPISYVPRDSDGNWGVVETLTFLDETLDNEIHVPRRLVKEAKVVAKFVFPADEPGFVTSCRTFFETILEHEIVHRARLRQLVLEILDSLLEEDAE